MRFKVGIVGAGNVGATTARTLIERDLAHVHLVDIVEGLAEGKALDISEGAPIYGRAAHCTGSRAFEPLEGSDVVVITAGIPRKPGMSREDLLTTNIQIVRNICLRLRELTPDAVLVVVTNPLDAMVHTASRITGFPRQRVLGMAGSLDSARFRYFIAEALGVAPASVSALVLGTHGDLMVPVLRFASVAGIPALDLLPRERLQEIAERTRRGGGEIVQLLKTSAFYAPASAIAELVEAILLDQRKVIPVSTFLAGEYGIHGVFMGVPAVIGRNGVERILEVPLEDEEKAALQRSAEHVRKLMREVDDILARIQ